MSYICPTACDFMFYKEYETDLKFLLVISMISFRTQNFTCSLAYHHIIIHYCVFSKTIQGKFITISSMSLWLCTLSSIACWFFKFFQAFCTVTVLFPKMISLYSCFVSTIAFSRSCLEVYSTFLLLCNNFGNVLIRFSCNT